jgi:hypothetical protein
LSTNRYDELMREFFEAQPHWLTNDKDVCYIHDGREGEESTLCFSLEVEKAFLRWAVDTGRLRHSERVQRFRILLGMEDPPHEL